VDLIRVVAIFLVIVIHVAANLLYGWGKIPLSDWMAGNIYDSISRISVPLLFMISGSLLLAKNEPMKDFFQKRALKLLIPFIGWSLIYLFWRCNINEGVCSKKIVLHLILFEGTSYHLWFVYALIGIYLITPLLRLIAASNQKAILWYFVALWLFFESGTAILDKAWGVSFGISVPMATGYIGFFILGYLLGETHLLGRNVLLIFIIWLASTTATAAGTYFISIQAGEFDGFFYEYLSINVILSSVSAFVLLKSLSKQKFMAHPVIFNLLNRITTGSFGIYLIHVLVLDIIGGRIPLIHFNAEMGHPMWSIPLVSGVAFMASFCAVYILQKIPIINRIVP
jgi:surface polysaccharide O-acyltransferase-like enzyme